MHGIENFKITDAQQARLINNYKKFDVLLTVHFSILILVINQIEAQNLF